MGCVSSKRTESKSIVVVKAPPDVKLGADEVTLRPGARVQVKKGDNWFPGVVKAAPSGAAGDDCYQIDFGRWQRARLPQTFSCIKMDAPALRLDDTRWHMGQVWTGNMSLKATPVAVGEVDVVQHALPLEILAGWTGDGTTGAALRCKKVRCGCTKNQWDSRCSFAAWPTPASVVVRSKPDLRIDIHLVSDESRLAAPRSPVPYCPPSPPRSRSGGCPSPASGGCFSADGLVAVGKDGEHVRRVDQVRVGDRVFSPNLGREVEVLATTLSLETKICTINGLRISRKHPIKFAQHEQWVAPEDIAPGGVTDLATPIFTHNFVVSEGGTMLVNSISVVTLGDNEAAALIPIHPYYGTCRVVEHLKTLPSWPECRWGCSLVDGSEWGDTGALPDDACRLPREACGNGHAACAAGGVCCG